MAKLEVGDEAILFELPGVDGETHSFSGYRDKDAVAVIFTCNHCPYARAWEDRIVSIQNDYDERGLQVLAISANDAEKYPDDSFTRMQQRAEEKHFSFPYLQDESQEIAAAYGAERTPEVFLFDGDRKLAYHGTVDDNYDDPNAVRDHYLRDAIEAVLGTRNRRSPRPVRWDARSSGSRSGEDVKSLLRPVIIAASPDAHLLMFS